MFLGREQNDPGRKTPCLKYRIHFGAQSPWKYVVGRFFGGKMLEFEDSNLQGFWFFWSPKYGVCCWKIMDLNLFWKFGEFFFWSEAGVECP